MNTTDKHNIDYISLIINYLSHTISEVEIVQLIDWVNADHKNKVQFNNVKDAWMLADAGKTENAPDSGPAWEHLQQKLNPDHSGKYSGKRITSYYRYIRIAATWLVFIALGSILTLLFTRNETIVGVKPVSVSIPLGAKGNITLPDGSKVWLNAGTTLTYNQDYGLSERKLYLTGEAFFDVTKDKLHPFLVETSGIIVRAVGTRFNVKAYPDEKTISATLEEGIIDVRLKDSNGKDKNVLLTPKEKIVYFRTVKDTEEFTESADDKILNPEVPKSGKPIELRNVNVLTDVNTQLYTSWKDNRWIVEGEQLGTLAPMLERRFNMKIVFDNEELKKYKFSGTLENETIDQILNALKLSAPVDYKINKDVIRLILNASYEDEFGRIMTRN